MSALAVAARGPVDGEGSDKRPGAFRTISEVATELDVPQHVLRFWETRFAQIKPVKRAGGRRYYRPEDVDLLKGVRRLLHRQGYTIRGAQRVLKERGIRFVQAIGRGEAEAAAPAPEETEAPAAGRGSHEAVALGSADRPELEAVLYELRTCRDVLESLTRPPAEEDDAGRA